MRSLSGFTSKHSNGNKVIKFKILWRFWVTKVIKFGTKEHEIIVLSLDARSKAAHRYAALKNKDMNIHEIIVITQNDDDTCGGKLHTPLLKYSDFSLNFLQHFLYQILGIERNL